MFKINKKVEYALIALRHISSSKQTLISAKEICDAYSTPFDTTSRVLQIMAQNDILKAAHGAYGGYQLTKDISKITFFELIEMIVGPIGIANCIHGSVSQCDIAGSCNVISPMITLNDKMCAMFKTINVSDLIYAQHSKEKSVREKLSPKTHSAGSTK